MTWPAWKTWRRGCPHCVEGDGDDPARLAGWLPVRGPSPASRLDPARGRRRLRDHLQAGPGAGPPRGDLRGQLRGLVRGAVPVQAPPRGILDKAGRVEVAAVHLHLRDPRRYGGAPGADHPRADRELSPELQCGAVLPHLEARMDRRREITGNRAFNLVLPQSC